MDGVRFRRFFLLLLAMLCFGPCAASALPCVADCDGSGRIGVDELVLAGRISLDQADLGECEKADMDGSGVVTIDELVTGVAGALHGCSPPPVAAVALAVARLGAQVHTLSRAVAVAFDGSDRTEQCVFGGTLDNMCEDPGTGFVRVDIDARACRVESLEGDITYDGPVVLNGNGRCDIVIPSNLRFDFDWTGVTEREDGSPHLELRWLGKLRLESFAFGPSPCSVKGARSVLSDRVSFRTPDDDAELGIDADDLRVAVGFEDLLPDFACEPQRLVATLDGAVRVEDRYGVNGTQVVDVTLKGLKTTLSRVTRQLEIDGDFEAPCLGGTVHVETTEPIGAPLGTGCFDAGRLQIGLPTGTAALRFGPGTGLAVDRDGDGNFEDSYASCGELPRDTACEP